MSASQGERVTLQRTFPDTDVRVVSSPRAGVGIATSRPPSPHSSPPDQRSLPPRDAAVAIPIDPTYELMANADKLRAAPAGAPQSLSPSMVMRLDEELGSGGGSRDRGSGGDRGASSSNDRPPDDSGIGDRRDDDAHHDSGSGGASGGGSGGAQEQHGFHYIDPDEEAKKAYKSKKELIARLIYFRDNGVKLDKEPSIHMTLEELETAVFVLEENQRKRQGVKILREGLEKIMWLVELVNGKFDPFGFKLKGIYDDVREAREEFQQPLERLYEKWKHVLGEMHPLVEIFFLLTVMCITRYQINKNIDHAARQAEEAAAAMAVPPPTAARYTPVGAVPASPRGGPLPAYTPPGPNSGLYPGLVSGDNQGGGGGGGGFDLDPIRSPPSSPPASGVVPPSPVASGGEVRTLDLPPLPETPSRRRGRGRNNNNNDD